MTVSRTDTNVTANITVTAIFAALAWVAPRLPLIRRFALAVCLEGGWEVLENTRFIIERYGEGTIALGYEGDSILNSLGTSGAAPLASSRRATSERGGRSS